MKKNALSFKLRAHRKQKGMTQEELAKLLEVNKTEVKRWEVGATYPSQRDIEKIADVLDIAPDILMADVRFGGSRLKRSIKYALTSYFIIFVLIIFIRSIKNQGQYEDIFSRGILEIFGIVVETFAQNIFIAIVPALIIGLVFYFYLFPREQKEFHD